MMDFAARQKADAIRKASAACDTARLALERARLRANEAEFNLGMADGGKPATYYEIVTKRVGEDK